MITVKKGKIPKKNKEPVEFGADNIDNTAPVKKILDALQQSNTQAFSFYCKTVRPRTRYVRDSNNHFTLTGHTIHAFGDDWDGDLNSGYFEPFLYKSLIPKMITPLQNIDLSDPVTSHLKLKNDWLRDCRHRRRCAVVADMANKYEIMNDEVVQCPKYLVELAALLDSNPDPYFDDPYNWYYAGNGNLQPICIDWVDYLLHSVFNILYLIQFSKNYTPMIADHHAATFDCGENIHILETICSAHNIIALRTKYKVFILKITSSNNQMQFEKIKSIESELPFTNISYDTRHKNILYVTSLSSKVTIINLDRLTGRTVKLRTKINTLVNNWNMVISSDRITYTHVSRNSISLYDKRTNSIANTWDTIREVTDHLGCNDITVAKQCEGSSNLYYGTNHHLFLLDIRQQRKIKPKALLRWTHGMQCVPIYMSTCNFEYNKELICLSSQWCEDLCVVPNYVSGWNKEGEMPGVTIPYRVSSMLDTLKEARDKLLCYNLYNPIENRLSTSITGHTIFEHNENYVVLMHNSLGDISWHMLYPQHMESFIEDDGIKCLKDWSKLYMLEKKPLEVSNVEDITNVWKTLKKVPEAWFGSSKNKSKKSNKIEKEILESFEKDLDSGLLDVWTNDLDETSAMEKSSLAINSHYSDDSNGS